MLRRALLASIPDNKTPKKELSLFDPGRKADLSRANLTSTEIHRNLDVPRTTIQSILGRLHTDFSGFNERRTDLIDPM